MKVVAILLTVIVVHYYTYAYYIISNCINNIFTIIPYHDM